MHLGLNAIGTAIKCKSVLGVVFIYAPLSLQGTPSWLLEPWILHGILEGHLNEGRLDMFFGYKSIATSDQCSLVCIVYLIGREGEGNPMEVVYPGANRCVLPWRYPDIF